MIRISPLLMKGRVCFAPALLCCPIHRSAWNTFSRKFAKGTSTFASLIRLAESLLWGLYRVCVTTHTLPGALIGSKDHR